MKFKLDYTLGQLLKVYDKNVTISKALSNEKVGCSSKFIVAVNRQEHWIDAAIERYLGSIDFLNDLKIVKNRMATQLEGHEYWLQIDCNMINRRPKLIVCVDKI